MSSWGTTPSRARMSRPVGGRVHAQHPELAAGDRGDAGDHAHRRGLARAVRAEEAERLARLDPQVDPGDRHEVAEPLREPAPLDQRLGRVITLRRYPRPRPDPGLCRRSRSRADGRVHAPRTARDGGRGVASGRYGEADVRGVGRREPGRGRRRCATALLTVTAPSAVRRRRASADGGRARRRGGAGTTADADARGEEPLAALVSVWIDAYDRRAPFERALAELGRRFAGYLVVESVYDDYGTTEYAGPRRLARRRTLARCAHRRADPPPRGSRVRRVDRGAGTAPSRRSRPSCSRGRATCATKWCAR